MEKTTYRLSKMDCSSEETMVRMKLEPFDFVKKLEFDLGKREVTVFHDGHEPEIRKHLEGLQFGMEPLGSAEISGTEPEADEGRQQRKLLWTVLAINLGFFVIEMAAGWLAQSMGLIADSLDMLADSLVYALSLMVVGHSVARKLRIARMSGYFQLLLAFLGFAEVVRRFLGTTEHPDYRVMMVVAALALVANAISLWLFSRSRSKQEAHMKASQIFTSNDVIINGGVILAGALVWFTHSSIPDLVIGAIVFLVVIKGALRILKLK
jgi:Co/Zn/Cd efflux system component